MRSYTKAAEERAKSTFPGHLKVIESQPTAEEDQVTKLVNQKLDALVRGTDQHPLLIQIVYHCPHLFIDFSCSTHGKRK
ncbi:hypothetical protein N7539_003310 [Penicillium diatomitis]|uniref:Uncharacterized protein n=1 Tax=Penicillium diatomitis TaxID=2819901 RepID=A0A9X0BZW9_9EURO|nr:uncharacterized protein N7539_003310 [Penicillium diatomitis]KAJ5491743.1 hypothetical protein N7539_003310 [Penicillium diatomitis]